MKKYILNCILFIFCFFIIEDLFKINLDKLSIETVETVRVSKYRLEAINYYNIFENLKCNVIYGIIVKYTLDYILL